MQIQSIAKNPTFLIRNLRFLAEILCFYDHTMIFNQCYNSKNFLLHISITGSSHNPIFIFLINNFIQKKSYVNVYMKWKKDPFFDSIESIHRSLELKPVIALKNYLVQASPEDYSIPISDVSKKGLQLDIPIKVARFFRKYPSFFEEFKGPKYDLPWFRLSQKAIAIDREERDVYEKCKLDVIDRLRKVVLMSIGEKKVLPLRVIKGLQWNLGLPSDFLKRPQENSDGIFRIIDITEREKGLCVVDCGNKERILSAVQKNAMRKGIYEGGEMEGIAFPLFPSKGLRLRRKISEWLDGFQKLPYVSPYEEFSGLNSDADLAEKRIVGMLHELLSLFVEQAAERKRFLCLRKYLGFPQKVHKAFERHPHIFYLSLRNNTCTAILKEAYRDESAIEPHPLAKVRKKYIALLHESAVILRGRRMNNQGCSGGDIAKLKDLGCMEDVGTKVKEGSI